MSKLNNPLSFIDALRQTDPSIRSIYMCGGCFAFADLLVKMYPYMKYRVSQVYINNDRDHAIAKIADEFYDINGVVKVTYDYHPASEEDIEEMSKWSFSKNHVLTKECPVCEEPLPIQTIPKFPPLLFSNTLRDGHDWGNC